MEAETFRRSLKDTAEATPPGPWPRSVRIDLPPGVTTERITRVLPQIDTSALAPHDAVAALDPTDLAVVLDVAARGFRASSPRLAHTLRSPQSRRGT